jgi:rhodanese-related sulfurtransferase
MNTPATITPQEAAKLPANTLFLDVRTPAEYQDTHVKGAVLHPLSDLDPEKVRELAKGSQRIVVVCKSGGRARQACEKLSASGLSNLIVLEGGTLAWEGAGLPVSKGRKAISLERQVRIAAGALVLLGAVLGYYVHPAFIALSGFIGAGLIFAGVTDTCGMGMLLAKMPWNNIGAQLQGSGCCTIAEPNKKQ